MKIQKPRILVPKSELCPEVLTRLERYGRVCYKSENKMMQGTTTEFLGLITRRGHESIIEHEKVTVLFIIDRGVSHEVVRHRIASYSQESTRYCNYSKEKFGGEISVIEPFYFVGKEDAYRHWKEACLVAEKTYIDLLEMNCSPQEARSVLPNSLKTEIVVTYNLREWRHFFRLRAASAAHPQMRQVAIPLLLLFKRELPVLFADIKFDEDFPPEHYGEVVWTDDLLRVLPQGV